MADEARLLKKKLCNPNLGPMDLNQAQNEVFHHFLEFGSLVLLEIAYNDNLQQFLTFRRNKTHKKKHFWGPNLG